MRVRDPNLRELHASRSCRRQQEDIVGRHSSSAESPTVARFGERTTISRRALNRLEHKRLMAELAARQNPANGVPLPSWEQAAHTAEVAFTATTQTAGATPALATSESAVSFQGSEEMAAPSWPSLPQAELAMLSQTELAPTATDSAPSTSDFTETAFASQPAPRRRWWLPRRSRSVSAAIMVVAAALSVTAITVGGVNSAGASMARIENPATLTSHEYATDDPTAITFTVVVDGTSRQITSSAPNLAAALEAAGISVDADDRVSAAMAAPVLAGARITVTRVEITQVSEQVEDPYQSTQVEDANLAKGTTKVTTAGVNGVTTNTYDVTYEDGKEVSRNLVISATTTARVDEVVSVGTKEEVAANTTSLTSLGSAVAAPVGEAQQIALNMLPSFGFGQDQFTCLVNLWNRESGWNSSSLNRSSGAYGIPQALPGSKMASAGADWQTNPATQIKWGLGYISGRYGTPCGAWSAFQSKGWY